MKTFLWVALAIVAASARLGAVSEAYPRTAPGDLELKTLPAARWIRTESAKDYFAADNGLFMKLFRYIDSNKIPMTAPVEMKLDGSETAISKNGGDGVSLSIT